MKIRKMLMIALLFFSSVAVFGQAKKPYPHGNAK